MKSNMVARFWGVRGSIATPGPDNAKYGGNTSCVQLQCGGRSIVFDCGTGIRQLGDRLLSEHTKEIDIFLSHCHLDHVVGLPFFMPLYNDGISIRFWAGHLGKDRNLEEVVCQMMNSSLFPISPKEFSADVVFNDFRSGSEIELNGQVTLKTVMLNHPGGATGYRVTHNGKVFCYVTDTEHTPDKLSESIIGLIKDADVLVYDCTYTDDEYEKFAGWGHSTWQEAVRLCDAAKVKQLVIFHHDPSHNDAFMDEVAIAAEKMRPGTIVAKEGLELPL